MDRREHVTQPPEPLGFWRSRGTPEWHVLSWGDRRTLCGKAASQVPDFPPTDPPFAEPLCSACEQLTVDASVPQ